MVDVLVPMDMAEMEVVVMGNPMVSVAWLTDASAGLLRRAGVPDDDALEVAAALVESDRRGVPSHGVLLLPMYLDRIRDGSVDPVARPEVVHDGLAVLTMDARNGLGQVSARIAMAEAVTRAATFGIGAVTVRRAFHFGGAYRWAEQAASAGLVGIAASNTRPLMPAPGGADAVVGNNPLAVAIPGDPGQAAFVLDMALSEAALGKIRLAAQAGREIPATWATDADGRPTTDPTAAIAGLLLPAAGPKGYGLALVLDVLTGALSGGSSGSAVKGLYADTAVPNDCAHLFLAIDPAAFGDPAGFRERVATLVAEVRASRLAPGVSRVVLPGQMEAERAAAASALVALDDGTTKALRERGLDEPPGGAV